MEVAEEIATTEPLEDLTTRDVQALADLAAALVSRLVPGEVPLSWMSGICAAFDRLERLGAAGKTLLADRLAESRAWERAGCASAAEYMANRAGCSVTNARDTLAASRRLADLPATEARLREGVLSTSQVHQITDAAFRNPAAESTLLDKAIDGSSLHELRDACGRAKAAADKDDDDRAKRLRAQRRLRQRRDTDGAWSLWARGTVPDAARFNAAVEEIVDGLLQDAHDRGEPLTREQAAYDALIEMADRVITTDWTDLDHETGDGDDGDCEVGDEAGDGGRHVDNGTGEAGAVTRQDDTSSLPGNDNPPSRREHTDNTSSRPSSDRTHDHGTVDGSDRTHDHGTVDGSDRTHDEGDDGNVDEGVRSQVRVDHLDGEPASPSGRDPDDSLLDSKQRRRRPRRKAQPYLGIIRADIGALRRGYPIDGEVVEIAGLGSISVDEAREILGGDAVLQLVLTNGVHANVTNFRRSPNTAQRMALLAQMPCCSVKGCNRTWTQIDHRHDWAATHRTSLEALDPLCYFHHRLKTLKGWGLVNGTGKRAFGPPDHPLHPSNGTGVAAARTGGSGVHHAPTGAAAVQTTGDGPGHGTAGVTTAPAPEAGWDGLDGCPTPSPEPGRPCDLGSSPAAPRPITTERTHPVDVARRP